MGENRRDSNPARFNLADTENVKLIEFQSPMLAKFWGRAITMRAGVVLPPSYDKSPKKTYAGVYHVHGFGGDHNAAWRQGTQFVKEMGEGKSAEMIHIFLNGSFPTGHHEFADSVNNGPWNPPAQLPTTLCPAPGINNKGSS